MYKVVIFVSSSILFQIVLILPFAYSNIFGTPKPEEAKLSIKNQLIPACLNNITKTNTECIENIKLKWNGARNKDLSSGLFCCYMWDILDCFVKSVKEMCNPINLFKMDFQLSNFKKVYKLECADFFYHSKGCGRLLKGWERGVKEPTVIPVVKTTIFETPSTVFPTEKLVIVEPTFLPYTKDCHRAFNNVGPRCNEKAMRKFNITFHKKMIKGKIKEEEIEDECCCSWYALKCVEDGIKGHCNGKEILYFRKTTKKDMGDICDGPEHCEFSEVRPKASGQPRTFLFGLWPVIVIIAWFFSI